MNTCKILFKPDVYVHVFEKVNAVKKKSFLAGCQWLTPVILATQERDISRIAVQSQPEQIVHETLSQKTLHKNWAGGVAQGEGSEIKPQYHEKKKIIFIILFNHLPQQLLKRKS
jgi:hypothetical protein